MKRYIRSDNYLGYDSTTLDGLIRIYFDGYNMVVDDTNLSQESMVDYITENVFRDIQSVTLEDIRKKVVDFISNNS